MNDAEVVAQTLETTMARQAHTRESYEQEVAALSAKIIELRSALDFAQTAISLHGKFERDEAERQAAHEAMLEELDQKFKKEEEEREKKGEEEFVKTLAPIHEKEIKAVLAKEAKENAARLKKEEKELVKKWQGTNEYMSSLDRHHEESMALLEKLKEKVKKHGPEHP